MVWQSSPLNPVLTDLSGRAAYGPRHMSTSLMPISIRTTLLCHFTMPLSCSSILSGVCALGRLEMLCCSWLLVLFLASLTRDSSGSAFARAHERCSLQPLKCSQWFRQIALLFSNRPGINAFIHCERCFQWIANMCW